MKFSRALVFWTRIALQFLLHSGRSTAIMLVMVSISVAALIFLSALAVGINDAMVRNSVGLFSGHITGTQLPPSLSAQILTTTGVAAVVKRVQHTGLLQHGARFGTLTLIASSWIEEAQNTALARKIVQGRPPQDGQREILISQKTAQDLVLAPGDTVKFRTALDAEAIDLAVSGVYQTGIEQLDNALAFIPPHGVLPTDGAWSAAVFLKDGVEPDAVAAYYHKFAGNGAQFKTWAELMPDLRQLIELNYLSMSLVTVMVFALVALGVAGAFVIFILKHLREFAIVKAMGVGPWETSLLITLEVLLLNVIASCAGLLVGVLAVGWAAHTGIDMGALTSHNRYFAVSGVVIPRLSAYSAGLPPLVALIFSLGAALWPALLVARGNTADILRAT